MTPRLEKGLTVLTIALLALGTIAFSSKHLEAAGAATIAVTSTYWGTNPQSPSTARPGDVNVQLSVVLTNVGEDVARDVNATLLVGPPLVYRYYLDGKEYSSTFVSKAAGDILAGSSFTVAFMLAVESSAEEGIYRCRLLLSYRSARDLQQITVSSMIDVPIWRSDLRVQKVSTTPTKIFAGNRQVRLKIALINSGKGTANNVQLQLMLKPPFKSSSGGSDRFYLGDLHAGEISEMDFMIDVLENAVHGQYSMVLAEEHGSSTTPVDQFPLYVEEKVRFTLNVTPSSVQIGAKGVVIRAELRNTGSVKAESIRVQLLVGNMFTGTLTDFLGTLLSGETKVASFTIDVDSNAQEGKRDFDLRIDWIQEDSALNETIRLSLNVYSKQDTGMFLPLGLLIVLLVGGYFVVKRYKIKLPQFLGNR